MRVWILLVVWAITACGGGPGFVRGSVTKAEAPADPPGDIDFVVAERVFGEVADPSQPLPWIVALHGMGGRAESFLGAFAGWTGPPVRVLALQAPTPRGRGWSWFPVRVGENRPEVLGPAVEAQATALSAAIDVLASRPDTRGLPVVTGFSQGGILSFALGLRHPRGIAGSVPVSGWLAEGLVPPHGPVGPTVPIRAIHGSADTVLPFVPVRRGVDRLRAGGFDVTMRGFDGVGHAIPREVHQAWHAALVDLLVDEPVSPAVAPEGPSR